jgi:hypothetical protein
MTSIFFDIGFNLGLGRFKKDEHLVIKDYINEILGNKNHVH